MGSSIQAAPPRRETVEQLAEEFVERYRRGERPSLAEYTERYPDHAEQIRDLFPALVMIEQIAPGSESDAVPGLERFLHPRPGEHPEQIGDYRILGEIGRGGMGVVYEAEQISLGRRVALKVLPRQASSDPMIVERFRREARAAARLHHTNIVPVYDIGEDGNLRFFAMQFILGQSLDLVIGELRRLRNRAGSGPRIGTAFVGPTQDDEVEVSAVLRFILTGRFDAGGQAPERLGASQSTPAAAIKGRSAAESAAALTRPETVGSASESAKGPRPADPRAPALSSSDSPSSRPAILPGGTDLSSVESGRRAFFRSVAHVGRQVAGGLAYAHARGIVHRDIKPSNLLLDSEGLVWIADFGLAKGDDEGLTHTGDILGTLRYMAPERFRGEGDARADVYALGLTLYELLTLRPAFDSSDRLKLIEQIKTAEPQKPRAADARIPRDLETIVLKAIEKDPRARYQSAEAMAEDMRRFLADEPIRARRTSVAERSARWARRHPGIAGMAAALLTVLILAVTGSLIVAGRMARLAGRERSANQESSRQAKAESLAREEADQARAAAQAETYRATLSEVKALRAGRQPGWRDLALAELSRLAVMPTPRRDLVELRTEAVASLGTPDIRLVARIEFGSDHLRSIDFSPDSQVLVTANLQTGLEFWDMLGKRLPESAQGMRVSEGLSATRIGFGANNAVYLGPDRGLAVATKDHGVVFTDLNGIRTPRAPITRGASRPIRLATGALGRRIAVNWTDGAGITVHDAESGTLLERFDDSTFALSPDGDRLARTELGNVVMHRIGSGEPKVVIGNDNGVRAFAFSADGALLAGACTDQTTMLWHVEGRKQFGTLRGHRANVTDVAFSPDGEWIATTSTDYTTRIWETRTGQTLATLPGAGDMNQIVWSHDGNFLAAITNWYRTVFLYRVTGRNEAQQWLTGAPVGHLAVAGNPRREEFTTLSGGALTWDVSTPRPTRSRIGGDLRPCTALAFSPDGTLLATASASPGKTGTIQVRDTRSGELRRKFRCQNTASALAFDESGQRLACGGLSGSLLVWDLASNCPIQKLASGSDIFSVAFLDGDLGLVTNDKDGVLLYNLQSGQLKQRVPLQGIVRRFAVDRVRSRLVVAFVNGAIGSLGLPELTLGHRLENAHDGSVEGLAVSPDGRLVATGGADHRVVLRDALTFEPLFYFPEWTRTLRDIAFDGTSGRLAIVGSDSDLDLWNVAALRDGLTHVGLAWAGPAPVAAPSDDPPRTASPTP